MSYLPKKNKKNSEINIKNSTSELLKIGQAAKVLGVSIDTLRRWEKAGKLQTTKTPGGTRLYSLEQLEKLGGKRVRKDDQDSSSVIPNVNEESPADTGIKEADMRQRSFASTQDDDSGAKIWEKDNTHLESEDLASPSMHLEGVGSGFYPKEELPEWVSPSVIPTGVEGSTSTKFIKSNELRTSSLGSQDLATASVLDSSTPYVARNDTDFDPLKSASNPWRSVLIVSSLPVILTLVVLSFHLVAPSKAELFFAPSPTKISFDGKIIKKSNALATLLSPFNAVAVKVLSLGNVSETSSEIPHPVRNDSNGNPREAAVLAESTEGYFLEINSDTTVKGLLTADSLKIKGLNASGDASLEGILGVGGAVTFEDALAVRGAVNLSSTLTVTGNTSNTTQTTSQQIKVTSNSADAFTIQPTTDPSSATRLLTVKNAAGTTTQFYVDSSGNVVNTGTLTTTGKITGSGELAISGASTLTGAVTASSTLKVSGDTTLSGALAVSGASTLSGAITGSSTLAVSGSSTLSGAVTASSTLAVTGATTLSSTLAVTGAATLSSYLQLAQISAPSTTTNRLYNVSGNLVWNGTNLTAGGSLPVGTTGQTMYNSSGTWTASSNLYHNGSNVGIGTTAPASKLGVLGNLSLGATYGTVAAPTSGLIVEGNVGIGTTAPGNKFAVVSADNTTNPIAQFYPNNLSQNVEIGYEHLYHTGASNFDVGKADGTSRIRFTPSTTVQLITNGLIRQTIDSGGNVGIGTTAPTQKLEVVGSIALPTTINSTSGVIYKGADRFIHNFNLAGTDGSNTFVGINAGNFTMTGSTGALGSYNTALGQSALQANTTGQQNTAVGNQTLQANTAGEYNTAIGMNVLRANTTGSNNSAIGAGALIVNTTGGHNSALGISALGVNTTGSYNSAIGSNALPSNTSGSNNVAVGYIALHSNTTGSSNSALGFQAGYNSGVALQTITNSVFIGANANASTNALTNVIAIGDSTQATKSNQVVLGNASIVETLLRGNVGIGTTAPGAALEIGGSGNVRIGGLTASSGVYTDANKQLTSTAPTSGTLGYWSRTGTTLSTSNANDIVSIATTNTTGADLGITNTGAYTGTGIFNLTANSATTGTLANITGNALTTGKALSITSTSTALTTGNLISLDWSPSSTQSTAATGNLFNLNIGANATNFAGNLFNVADNSSSIFSISKTSVTTSLPLNVTAAGDSTFAYDLQFTNPTASFVKSLSALTLQAGESFNSSDLTLKTYNQGSVVVDSAVTTGTGVDIQNTTLTTGYGLSFTGPSSTGITGSALYAVSDIGSAGKLLNLAPDFSGSAVTGYGIYNAGTDSTATANTNYGYYGSLTMTGNAAKNGYGIYQTVTSSSTTADTIYAANLATSVTGIMTTGTRNVYGLYANPSAGAESTGGTTNVYGGYFKADADVAAGGTVNGYGLYIANGAFDTDGTSTQYGLYVAEPTGADTNYSIYSAGGVNYFGGNVGIGTTAPGYKLHVAGSRARIDASSEVYALGVQYATTTAPVWIGASSSGTTPDMIFSNTGGTELVRFTHGGNVGIGTTAPGSKLQINTTTANTTGALIKSTDDSTTKNLLEIQDSAGTAVGFLKLTSTTGGAQLGLGDGFTITKNPGAYAFLSNRIDSPAFMVSASAGGTVLGYFDANGVQIPTSGAYGFYGEGNTISHNSTTGNMLLTGAGGTINGVYNNTATSIFGVGEAGTPTATTLRGAAAAGTNIAGANLTFDASNGTGTGGSGALIFRTAPTGSTGSTANTLAEIMRITPGGNVGIGTTAPGTTLDVVGTGRFSSTLTANTFSSSGVTITGGSINGTTIGASTPSTGAFTTLSSTGVTTIGNNSATVAIDSSDWNITTTGSLTGIGDLSMDGNFSQTGTTTFSTGTGAISLNGDTTIAAGKNLVLVSGAGTYTQTFTGTTTTASTLTASALTSGNLLDLSSTSTTATSADLLQGDHTATYTTAQTVSGNLLDLSRALTINAAATTLTVSGAVATISDNCTVTAGTCTHTGNVLDITQNFTSSTGTALYLKSYGADAGVAFRVDDVSGDTSPFVVMNTGNVGIGTTAPGAKLDINGLIFSSNTAATGTAPNEAESMLVGTGISASNRPFIGQNADGRLYIGANRGSASAGVMIRNSGTDRWLFDDVGTIVPQTNNSYDLGTSTFLVKTGYFGTSIFNPLMIGGSGVGSTLTLKSTSGVGTTDAIIFQVGNNGATEAVRITNGGNVGIGTTAPGAKLQIGPQDTIGANTPTLLVSTAVSTKPSLLFTEITQRAGAIGYGTDNWFTLGTDSVGATGIKFRVGSDYSTNGGLLNSGTTAMVISSGGNVGIGTTAPVSQLDLFKTNPTLSLRSDGAPVTTDYFRFRVSSAQLFVERNTAAAGDFSTSQWIAAFDSTTDGFLIGDANDGTKKFLVRDSGARTTNFYTAYINATSTSSTASVNKHGLYVTSTGTWNGASANNYGLYIDTISGGTNNYSLYNNSTATSYFAGNVGIGTTAPGTTLDVTGTGRFSSTLTASSGLILTTGALSLTGTSGSISLTGFGTTSITSTTATGNINTLANDSLTTGTNLALTSTATALSSGGLLSLSKTGTSGSTAYTGDIANITYSQTFNGGVGLDSTGNVLDISRSITLNNTGNTHTISGALASFSDSGTQTAGTLTHTASLLDLTQNYTSSTGTALYLKSYGADAGVAFRVDDVSGDTSPFIVMNTGNVGIGTTAPGAKLQINTTTADTTGAIIRSTDNSTTNNLLTFQNSTPSTVAYLKLTSTSGGAELGLGDGFTITKNPGAYAFLSNRIDSPAFMVSTSAGGAALGYFDTNGAQIPTSGAYGFYGAGNTISYNSTTGNMILTGVNGTTNGVYNNTATSIFGVGEAGTPTATTLRGAAAAGTNIAGANFTFDASNGTGTGGSGALIFRTAPTGSTGTTANTLAEIMRITPGGNVGIGTTAPGAKLDVSGLIFSSNTAATGAAPTEALSMLVGTGITAGNRPFIGQNADGRLYIGANRGSGVAGVMIRNSGVDRWLFEDTGTLAPQANNSYDLGSSSLLVRTGYFGTSIFNPLMVGGTGVSSTLTLKSTSGVGTSDAIIFQVGNNGATEAMRITTAGNVGIGTTAPVQKLQVSGDVRVGTGTTGCVEDNDGTLIAGTCSSDIRFKKNVQSIGNVLDNFTKLNPVYYNWKTEEFPERAWGSDKVMGLVAQDVEKAFPELVTVDNRGYKQVNFTNLQFLTIQAVKEQQEQINQLKAMYQTDEEGYLVMPKIKAEKIIVNDELRIMNDGVTLSAGPYDSSKGEGDNTVPSPLWGEGQGEGVNYIDVASRVQSSEFRIQNLEEKDSTSSAKLAVLGENVASQSARIDELKRQLEALLGLDSGNASTSSASIYSLSEELATSRSVSISDDLNLTPPESLLATGSATLANINITEKASILNLEALDATISATFKSLGDTFLGRTTIAGDFSIDGTLSITGNSLNSISCMASTTLSQDSSLSGAQRSRSVTDNCGVLYIQNSPIASLVDIFNGLVTIDNTGKLSVESLSVGKSTLGSGTIPAGQLTVTIPATSVKDSSKIFLTPTSEMDASLIVYSQTEGSGFKVKLSRPQLKDVRFNWWIVEQR